MTITIRGQEINAAALGSAVDRLVAARWTLALLFALGLARGIVSLLAYPPAHGADSLAYFFYAERLAGLDIPNLAQLTPPLYPILILLSYKWLGSAYVLVIVQLLMSAAIVPLYFDAVRQVDGRLALAVGLVVLFDFQTAVMFNFLSTEPLYLFLLALSFDLFMRSVQTGAAYRLNGAAGISVALLQYTRAVARFIMLPLLLLHLWRGRSGRRTLIFAGGFAVSLLVYSLFSQALFKQVEGISSSSYMITGIAAKNLDWLRPENGPATVEFSDLVDACQTMRGDLYACYNAIHGSTDGLLQLLVGVTVETVRANIVPYVMTVGGNLNSFLRLSGQQLGIDPETPSAVQCADPNGRVNSLTVEDTYKAGWGWAWGMRNYIDNNFEEFRATLRPMLTALCPPWPDSPALRQVVDSLSFRYRSLGRPTPLPWYAAVVLLALIVPWIRRRYLTLVLAASVYLFNHALISAVIDNVQPRYVMVTNPYRATAAAGAAVFSGLSADSGGEAAACSGGPISIRGDQRVNRLNAAGEG